MASLQEVLMTYACREPSQGKNQEATEVRLPDDITKLIIYLSRVEH